MEEEDDLIELPKDVQTLASGKSFDFLNDDGDIYTEADLKEKH